MTLFEAGLLTLEECLREQSPTAHHTYHWLAESLVDRWGELNLTELQKRHVQAWANERRAQVKPQTLRTEISFLRRVYRVAAEHGYEVACPAHGLRLPSVRNARERVLLPTEQAILRTRMGDRNYSMVEFAIQTGMRRLEQFRLRVEDVRIFEHERKPVAGGHRVTYRGWATVHTSKTGAGRQVALNPIAAQIARRWAQEGGGWLFRPENEKRFVLGQCMSNLFRETTRELGINGVRWHDLRHTCASMARSGNAALDEVQIHLGHSNLNQSQRYVKYSEEHSWAAAMAVYRRSISMR